MLGWIGAVCVVSGAGLCGADVYMQRKKTLETTDAFLKTIIFMKEEMRYTKTLIENIFLKCADLNNVTHDFYNNIIEGIKKGECLNNVWRENIQNMQWLNDNLKAELLEMGEILGVVELDMQDNLITHKIEKITRMKDEIEYDLKTKGKVYPKIGFGVGTLLAVLLM